MRMPVYYPFTCVCCKRKGESIDPEEWLCDKCFEQYIREGDEVYTDSEEEKMLTCPNCTEQFVFQDDCPYAYCPSCGYEIEVGGIDLSEEEEEGPEGSLENI
jgi:hypothetical protein